MVRVYGDRLDTARVADLELTFQNRFAFFDALDIDYSTMGRDVSFQANNNYFLYDQNEQGGYWEASNNLLANDFDIGGQGLQIVALDGVAFDAAVYMTFADGGSVWIDSAGRIDFNAAGGFGDMVGGDTETRSFTYTVQNAAGQQDTATVTLIVTRPAEAVAAGATETFEARASDWSDNTTTIAGSNGYLGGFDGTDRVEKTFLLGADATGAQITFDFLEIDSWDNETFLITINGQEIDLGSFAWDTREGATGFTVGDITITKEAEVALSGYGNQGTAAWYANDGLHSFTIAHANPGETLTVGFSSNLSSGISDESWGIDNLTVTPLRAAPVLSISSDALSVPEGAAGTTTNLTFTLVLSGPSAVDITADVAISGNAAGPVSVLIPAGATAVPLVVTIAGDNLYEPDEPVTVTLSNLTGAVAGTLSATQTVLNDDTPPDPEGPLFSETFETGADGWSFAPTTVSNGNGYLGRFGNDYTEKTFDMGGGAGSATVTFDFLEIDSWDGESFFVYVNGQAIDLGTFSWQIDEGASSFTVGDITVTKDAATSLDGYGSGKRSWHTNDSAHTFTLDVANPGDSLTLGFASNLNQKLNNESWGIDNLTIDAFDFV